VERRGLSVLPNVTLLDQVTIGVSVVGQVRGVVMLGMSSETARQIVSVMAGKPESELSEMGLSALAELGNSAVGHAVLLLEGMGLSADITPPTISLGGNSHVTTFGLPSFVMPLSTQQGSVNLHVAVDLPPGQGSSR
jgi:chemotaxis protein CheX